MNILDLHPELVPFIGENYYKNNPKILFLGESHFLPKKWNNLVGQEWYTLPTSSYNFDNEDIRWLTTAKIIREDAIEASEKNSSHSIYRNIGNVFGEVIHKGDYRTALEYVAYSNYFLRPAETTGESIKLTDWEEEMISYRHLLFLNDMLNPDAIIFTSSKAYKSFLRVKNSPHSGSEINNIDKKINAIPHPGTSWWNRTSNTYNGLSGKDYLTNILKNL